MLEGAGGAMPAEALAEGAAALLGDDEAAAFHRDVGAALKNQLARYEDAEAHFLKALALDEAMHGPVHGDVAQDCAYLGSLYQDAGLSRHDDALAMCTRQLAIREQTDGADHPKTAEAANNVAMVYQDTGRLAEAAPLFARSLAVREAALGPHHPDVALACNNLAMLFADLGRRDEARR
jgi:tetratricopeptide (TPR) repeat protein